LIADNRRSLDSKDVLGIRKLAFHKLSEHPRNGGRGGHDGAVGGGAVDEAGNSITALRLMEMMPRCAISRPPAGAGISLKLMMGMFGALARMTVKCVAE
jgi:hypothetical protein